MASSHLAAIIALILALVIYCVEQGRKHPKINTNVIHGVPPVNSWQAPIFCRRGQACWPTPAEVNAFANELLTREDPAFNTTVKWNGVGTPQPDSVPFGSPGDQPMYGIATAKLLPRLYVVSEAESKITCFPNSTDKSSQYFCNLAARNNQYYGWNPAFIVTVTTEAQIQTALQFAADHQLCISVFGTGHEYNNRHSCPNGVLIKTVLMKSKEYLAPNSAYPNTPDGAMRLGPGLTFSEVHEWIETQHNKEMASGWCTTVGIVGWSTGGGHGPMVPSYGLGVDNTLDFDVWQIREGNNGPTAVKIRASENPSLLCALKGGGGSSFGIISSITLKAHPKPPKVSSINITATGTFCDKGTTPGDWNALQKLIKAYGVLQLELTKNFGIQLVGMFDGFMPFTGTFPNKQTAPQIYETGHTDRCKMPWAINILVFYPNNNQTEEYQRFWTQINFLFTTYSNATYTYNSQWDKFFDWMTSTPPSSWPIIPQQQPTPSPETAHTDGTTGVLVPRSALASGQWAEVYLQNINECPLSGGQDAKCNFVSVIYCSLTGQIGSPQPTLGVSVSSGMRSGILNHLAIGYSVSKEQHTIYKLGDYSYYSESSFVIPNWQLRYWDQATYDFLVQTKREQDPYNRFWCHHCIGDQPDNEIGWQPAA